MIKGVKQFILSLGPNSHKNYAIESFEMYQILGYLKNDILFLQKKTYIYCKCTYMNELTNSHATC